MDQVKVYLRLLKKHHFWVVCSLAALVGYLCWWMGANSLATETKANEAKVKGSYTALEGVNGEPRPPNASFEEGVKAKNEDLRKKVLEEWRERYAQQQQLFSWPALIADRVTSTRPDDPEYIDEDVRLLCDTNEVFLDELRDKVYLTADYRRPKAQTEEEKAEAKEKEEEAKPGVRGAAPAAEALPEEEGLVVWSKAHRELLDNRYSLQRQVGTPTSLDIRLAQEDMWVLENLAKVIRQTNEGAEDIIAAPIKRIDSLEVAQWAINDAVKDSPKIIASDSTEKAGGLASGGGGGPPPGGDVPPPTDPAEKEKAYNDELLNGRYIGDTGLPLAAGDPPPYAEFKLIFVRLKVVIDQRKIPDLLRNCGNAPIPIEVVRVTMHEPLVAGTKTVTNNSPAGGGLGGGRGLGGARPSGGLAGGAAQPANQNQGGDSIEANPSDVTVEVCGLVQLFSRPDDPAETDPSKHNLGKGGAAEPGKRPAGVPAAAVIEPRGGRSGGGGGGSGLGGARK